MSEFHLVSGGRLIPGEVSFPVINPATEEIVARCPQASPAQLDAAIASAHAALTGWQKDIEARREALRACAKRLQAQAELLGAILCQEQGKPIGQAIEEFHIAAVWLRETARLELSAETLVDDEAVNVQVRHVPLGVVGAITPWNYPILLAAWKIAPALLAGNAMVLKPSPYTPLSSLKMGEVLQAALPPGVLNVMSGNDSLGSQLSHHPRVAKVAFTGSVETGKKVGAAAATHLARLTLELGGNDAAIVRQDVDVEATAQKLFWGAFANTGQICVATKRLYVHEDIAEQLTGALVDIAESTRVGNGADPETQLGPLNNKAQYERIIELVADAKNRGATIRCGGAARDGKGYFYPPTIVTNIDDSARLVREEQFGPALPVLTFRDEDDVIARVNATAFGLGNSVWSADVDKGRQIADRLQSGTVWVNQARHFSPLVPFGGCKESGVGHENGRQGLESYTQTKIINTAKQ